MTKADVESMIRKSLENAYEGRDCPDCAAKMYFYPLSSALFSQDEWDGFMESDDLTVKPDRMDWVITEMGKRLGAIVKGMSYEVDDLYFSMIVYGGVEPDVIYHINGSGEVSIGTYQEYKPHAVA